MFHFIYNPTAGKGKAQRFREAIEKRLESLGVAYRFYETKCRDDAKRIVRELTEGGAENIVAMGGDGTVNEVLNGLADPSKVNLGLIPCGSGNDFAGAVGIPVDVNGALDVLLSETPKHTDYLDCSGIRCLNILGAGIDVDVLRRRDKLKMLKGSLNYYFSLLISLIKSDFYRFRAEFNEQSSRYEGLIISACNGRRLGGGMNLCPEATVDDGLMDIVMVVDVKKWMIPGALISLMQGRLLERYYTKHHRTNHLRVEFDPPAAIQIDGEVYENLPFDVSVVHNKLKMYRK